MAFVLRFSFQLVTLFFSFFFLQLAWAQKEKSSKIFYDAEDIQYSSETGAVQADGKAVFLLEDLFLSADHISYRDALVHASGHVVAIRNKELIQADSISVDRKTSEVFCQHVTVITDPLGHADLLNESFLGISDAELAFENARQERISAIDQSLVVLRESYLNARYLEDARRVAPGSSERVRVIKAQYARGLERLARMTFQPNAVIDKLGADVQIKLLKRRDALKQIIQESKDGISVKPNLMSSQGYIQLRADELYQDKTGQYRLTRSLVTPCRCLPTGRPVWSLSASRSWVEPGHYVTLRGTSLDLFTIPIVYAPWLKFPIKNSRETGFLLPTFYLSRDAGQVFVQPFFLTLGEYADATLTASQFSLRGTRGEVESRLFLRNDSKLYFSGQYISDKKYREESREQGASSSQNRWAISGSLNAPLAPEFGLKVDLDWASDNRYFTDFSRDSLVTQDIFAPKSDTKRFLTQALGVEYYGSDFVIAMRTQSQTDVFIQSRSDVPTRFPRIEFHLLPRRFSFFDVAYEAEASWENIKRLNGTSFVDASDPGFAQGGGASPVPLAPNHRREPQEPFLEGRRSNGRVRLSLPLPANDFVDASFALQNTATVYQFPRADPQPQVTAGQTYTLYQASLKMPLYAATEIERSFPIKLRYDFIPFGTFSYVPGIYRHQDFPVTSQLFYKEDDVAKQQMLEFGFDSFLGFESYDFKGQLTPLNRLPEEQKIPPGDLTLLQQLIDDERGSKKSSGKNLVQDGEFDELLRLTKYAPRLFDNWAEREMSRYEAAVLSLEGSRIYWPEKPGYLRQTKLSFQPLSLRVTTAYNFSAQSTAAERNTRLLPGEKPVEARPWSDVTAQLGWSLSPLLPLSGGVSGSWNRLWRRWSKANASINASYANVTLGFSNAYEVQERIVDASRFYLMDRTVGSSLAYQPLAWLKLQYQHERKLLQTTGRARNPENEYQSTQSLFFVALQDCLDIALQRYKSYEVSERMATWTLGFNLSFYGQKRDLPNAGHFIERAVQKL